MGTFAGHTGHRPYLEASGAYGTETYILPRVRSVWWKGYRPRVRPHDGSPKVPSGLLAVCFVLLLFRFSVFFLPKVASHGVRVSAYWLKSTCPWRFLTVLRHSWIPPCSSRFDCRISFLALVNGHQRRSSCQKHGMASQNFPE